MRARVQARDYTLHKRKKEEQYSLTYSAPVRLHRALPMGQSFFSVPVKILIHYSWKTKTSHLKVLLVYCNWVHIFFFLQKRIFSIPLNFRGRIIKHNEHSIEPIMKKIYWLKEEKPEGKNLLIPWFLTVSILYRRFLKMSDVFYKSHFPRPILAPS